MERRGEAVSKQVLLKEVWELPDYDLDTRVADDLVKRLRRKFREAGCRAAIETVWGYGFRLEEDRGERSWCLPFVHASLFLW
jgi:DNA-binding response OmpR family regulator